MKITNVAPDEKMIEMSWHEVLLAAGTNENDSGMERDMRFNSWINNRKYCIIDAKDYTTQQPKAAADGIEVLIIKGNNYVS